MTSHDACTSGTSRVLTIASLQRLKKEALIPAPADCESAVYDKVFEYTKHSADRNSWSAVLDLWPHTARRSTTLLQEYSWEVFNHHPPYRSNLATSYFHLFLHLKKLLAGQHQRFQNDRRRWVSQWLQSQAANFYHTACKSWSHGMINVSITEVNMLENSSTFAISVPIN